MEEEKVEKRESFEQRVVKLPEETYKYYLELKKHFLSFKDVKCRFSERCESFRQDKKLISKISLGGSTLKVFIALPANAPIFERGKYHQKDVSIKAAYKEVPTLLVVKSQLALTKVCDVIDYMMRHLG